MSAKRASPEQLERLLELMIDNPELALNKFFGHQPKKQTQKAWSEVATQLNALKGGTVKSSLKWSKSWSDWKFSVKKKAAIIRGERPDEGDHIPPTLNPLETRLISFIELENPMHLPDVRDNLPQFDDYSLNGSNAGSNDMNLLELSAMINDDAISISSERLGEPNCSSDVVPDCTEKRALKRRKFRPIKKETKMFASKPILSRILDLQTAKQQIEVRRLKQQKEYLAFKRQRAEDEMNFRRVQDEHQAIMWRRALQLFEKFLSSKQ